MTQSTDAVLDLPEPLPAEVPLPSFPVLARFRAGAVDERAAVAAVAERLAPVRGLFDEVLVERREDDGTWFVLARFWTVSVDAHTAVLGVDETLRAAGIEPDEVWVTPPPE